MVSYFLKKLWGRWRFNRTFLEINFKIFLFIIMVFYFYLWNLGKFTYIFLNFIVIHSNREIIYKPWILDEVLLFNLCILDVKIICIHAKIWTYVINLSYNNCVTNCIVNFKLFWYWWNNVLECFFVYLFTTNEENLAHFHPSCTNFVNSSFLFACIN